MLKKENFEVKGITLPVAYAVVRRTETNEYDRGAAFIGIGASREMALKAPIQEILVQFEITDRDTNDRKAAYLAATQPYTEKQDNENGELVDVEVKPFFHDWQDDFVTDGITEV